MKKAVLLLLLTCLVLLTGCGRNASKVGKIRISGKTGLEAVCNGKVFKGNPIGLTVRPGTYNFRIGAPGHYPRFSVIKVGAGQTKQIKVELEPIVSAVLIDSEPRGAKVNFRGEVRGVTPLVISDLPAGEYSARLSKPGYGDELVSWRIINERPHPLVLAKMRMISGQLQIKTIPSGSRIFIDDKEVGIAPFTATLEAGIRKVRVEREGCKPLEKQVVVESGKKQSLMMRLDVRPGSLRIESSPSGAEVFMDNEKIGTTPFFSESVSSGNHQLRLVRAGYDDLSKVITVVPGKLEQVDFVLEKSTGSASFRIHPAGVRYLVDGKYIGRVKSAGKSVTATQMTVIENLSPGPHVLTITHPRANPGRRDVRFVVEKGKQFVMKNSVDLWVANCEITFKDGKVEAGMIYSESESDIYYSPAAGIRYPVSRSYIRAIKYLPLEEK